MLAEGVTALIAGMGTVFVILIMISFIISMFKHIGKNKKPATRSEIQMKAVIQGADDEETEEEEGDDLELIAVLTAAIAASMNTTTDKLQVKSFRRIERTRR